MNEPVARPSRIPLIISLAALACTLMSGVLCYSWICAERELAQAKLELQRALQHRAEVEAQKAEEKKSAATPAVNEQIKKLNADVKGIKAGIARANRRAYSAEQATGEPDAPAGDSSNAWCPLAANGQTEWLVLEYEEKVKIAAVKVHENYGPGGLIQVSVVDDDGKETMAWQGTDPSQPGAASGVSIVPVTGNLSGNRIKIYLDSQRVQGWHEIDAVAIIDTEGKTYWASGARASSTYGQQQMQQPIPTIPNEAVPLF